MRSVLRHAQLDAAFKALVLELPDENATSPSSSTRPSTRSASTPCAKRCWRSWRTTCATTGSGPSRRIRCDGGYSPDPRQRRQARAGQHRRWRMLCRRRAAARRRGLAGARLPARQGRRQHDRAPRRTGRADRVACRVRRPRAGALPRSSSSDEPLVIDKWFACRPACPSAATAASSRGCRQLMQHPDFTLKNPNRARSLIQAFCSINPARLPPRRRGGLRVLGRPGDADRRHQPATRRAPRARAWTAGATWPSRTASAAREATRAAWPPRPTCRSGVREIVERTLAQA